MAVLKNVLVATDFSKSAGFALKRAAQLTKNITVLHIFPESWIDKAAEWLSNTKNNQFSQFNREAQSAFNKKIKPTLRKTKLKFLVKMGREDEVITRYAKEKKFDLLTIGAHGNYYFHEYFLGTTAEAVVKNSPCPVLIVKGKPDFRYNKILIPIDFSSASQKALEFACKFFPKSAIKIIHVEDLWFDKNKNRPSLLKRREGLLRKEMFALVEKKIHKFLKKCKTHNHEITYSIRGGYPAIVIAEEVKKQKIDLVVIGTRGQTKLQYLMIGSVAERVLRKVSTDIIAVPPN